MARQNAGGNELRAEAAQAVVGAGIAVMGHTGLMPQSVSVLGGFGPQGRTADSALLVIQDAIVRLLPTFQKMCHALLYCAMKAGERIYRNCKTVSPQTQFKCCFRRLLLLPRFCKNQILDLRNCHLSSLSYL